jgi:hypothetical protein
MTGTYEQAGLGEPNSTAGPKWLAQFKGMNEKLNSSNLLEDTGLTSPNNSAYRTIFQAQQGLTPGTGGGTYILGAAAKDPVASGANISGAGFFPFPVFYLVKADYEVANKTQKLRIRAQMSINATKPTQSFNIGLYPLTVAGGAAELKFTLGTAVSGSAVGFGEPEASTVNLKEGSDFSAPANGLFCLGTTVSTNLTTNSVAFISAQLQTRSV